MENLHDFFYDLLISNGISEATAKYLNVMILIICLLISAVIIDRIARTILRFISNRIARSTKTNFDDILITNRTPANFAHIVPLLVLYEFLPNFLSDFPYWASVAEKTLQIAGIVLILKIARSLLLSIRDYLKTLDNFKDKPIDSYIQVFMIFAWLFGIISIFAIITGISFLKFITTLGAASAIIILIFRDTILGFVASIQVSINDMVRIGDWVTFEKYGADGDVIEINLATVKVQNFDKTITTIPTYALISDSFKNWRGMMNSGGRRIKRSIFIKISTVKHLSEEEIEKLKKVQLIKDYLETKQKDIDEYNKENEVDKSLGLNGRNLTNLGVFRKYVETYVEKHSAINKEMTIMTRQLQPTPQGLPLEIYAFSSDKRWQNYEYIMADIFDHIIASAPTFMLELFEYPSTSTTIPQEET